MLEIIEHTQGSDEWKAHRMLHLNASEAPFVMGKSKKTTRDELLTIKATGNEKEFSKFMQDNVLDRGHAAEAGARPIIEKQYGIELSPLTGKNGKFSASMDGITFENDIGFECKLINKELWAIMEAKKWPEDHIWQMEHHFLVFPDLKKIIFTVSDGTEENTISQVYTSKPARRKKLLAAWELFEKDLQNFVVPEPVEKIEPVRPENLPALVYQVKGTIISTNLDEYKAKALQLVENAKKPLETDQEFADAAVLAKAFETAEEKIKLIKEQVLGEFTSLDQFTREISEIGELIRQARISTNKKIDAEKALRKNEIMAQGEKEVISYLADINSRTPSEYRIHLPLMLFQSATKQKSSLAKIREAVNQCVADHKLEINELADKAAENFQSFLEKAADFKTLFPDIGALVFKEADDFNAFIVARIATHQAEVAAQEAKRLALEEANKIAKQAQDDEKNRKAAELIGMEAPKNQVIVPEQESFEEIDPAPIASISSGDQSDEDHDIQWILHISDHLENLVFPEMKTARGQQISVNARNSLNNIAQKLITASKTI